MKPNNFRSYVYDHFIEKEERENGMYSLDEFLEAIDKELIRHTGLGRDDLPDYNWHGEYKEEPSVANPELSVEHFLSLHPELDKDRR